MDAFLDKFNDITSNQDPHNESTSLSKYVAFLERIRGNEENNKALEEDLMYSWNYSCLAFLTLSYETFIMAEIEKIFNIELKPICPQMKQLESDFTQTQFLARETEKFLSEHYRSKKEKFNTTKLSKTLKSIQKAKISEFRIKSDAKKVIKQIIEDSGINADVVNNILGIINQRALIYDTE